MDGGTDSGLGHLYDNRAMSGPGAIDLSNQFMVGASRDQVVIGRSPKFITPDEALVFAAWLVAVSQPQTETEFDEILTAVQAT